ncbi:MAG: hypothetical protein R3F56_03045 [Planctomycetota bacterium]
MFKLTKLILAPIALAAAVAAQSNVTGQIVRESGDSDLGARAFQFGQSVANWGSYVEGKLKRRVGSYRDLIRVAAWYRADTAGTRQHRVIVEHDTMTVFDENRPYDGAIQTSWNPWFNNAGSASRRFTVSGYRVDVTLGFGAAVNLYSNSDLFVSRGNALTSGDYRADMTAWDTSWSAHNLDGFFAAVDFNFEMNHRMRADVQTTTTTASGYIRMLSGGSNRCYLRVSAGGYSPVSQTFSNDNDTFGDATRWLD